MSIRRFFAALMLFGVVLPAQADWEGKGELGGVLARGNTETETLNAKADMTKQTEQWQHRAGFSVLRTTNDNVTSADRWELRGESDYKLTERSFVFGALRYEQDEFTDFEYQATGSVGYGYKFIDSEATNLVGRLGIGYRLAELRLTGESEDQAIVRGAVDFSHQLTETTRIVDRFLIEAGSDNTFLQNILRLEVRIMSALALGVGYEVRHNTDVQADTEKTDQVLTVSLVFDF